MKKTLLSAKQICKSYNDANHTVEILKNVDLSIFENEKLAILGASGSGKSTLLHILGTLDKPNSGNVNFDGGNLNTLSNKQQAKFRNQHLGFVYQFHHLLPEFNALENVAMPKLISGENKSTTYDKASQLLERVGLSHRLENKPHQLSGGERQRVAIARALINNPSIIMADEPTGNLDNESSDSIIALIHDINESEGTCFVIVTHDHQLAEQMDRTLTLVNGQFLS
ncbi:lipoprotein-releasing ABC transporter ATP-binding protein LolD [Glaciecola petra]|uniref:Lipoprotein-releasing system ATP-binding protein LolD n=1 Tax=Glaciecola petra TaxID=3075602 RepID=A0ABU2ZPC3_9ALTE|nr:lipoprotein-releasing ABC transporter ATP-binding protein LolD [Aestuariibacter sp. P117]MDT0594204.1 lipoprotein-releasing ABC transporter ATP-binding protein LolD [Aestuariibacter sp. P117]